MDFLFGLIFAATILAAVGFAVYKSRSKKKGAGYDSGRDPDAQH